jgi:transcriptional regulator with XRE-family HTH domain
MGKRPTRIRQQSNAWPQPKPQARSPLYPNNLRRLRLDRNWTQPKAAEELSMSFGKYKKLEYGEREIGSEDLSRIAAKYEVSRDQVLETPKTIQVVGFVGAGSTAHYYEEAQGPFDEVPMIHKGTPQTVAVEIRGESLGALFDRWLVYYDDIRRPPTMDLLRRLCVVGLEGGQVLIKEIRRGSEPGRFNLLSQTEGLIENVRIEWAAPVLLMAPR